MTVYDEGQAKDYIPGNQESLSAHASPEGDELERLYDAPSAASQTKLDTPQTLDELENRGVQPDDDVPATQEMDRLGKGFSGEGIQKRRAGALVKIINKRRAMVAGGAASTLLLGGGIGIFVSSVPALQTIHYSQILMSTNRHHENGSSLRLSRLYQYMRTGKVGSSRLTYLQFKLYPKMVTSLQDTGVRIVGERLTGQIKAVGIDTKKFSDLQGMTKEEVVRHISERYSVSSSKIYVGFDGKTVGTAQFSMKDMPLKNRELLLRDIIRQNGKGKINSYMEMRLLRKFYNVPSMFHPLQRVSAVVDDKELALLRKSKRFRDLEAKRSEKLRARTPEARERLAKIKTRAGAAAGAAGAVLAAQLAICTAYDAAISADQINQENFRDPAVKSGVDGQAVGEQVAANSPDATAESVAAFNENLTDPVTKLSAFDSQAIRALQGKPGGIPVDRSLRAAFSLSNEATTLKNKLESEYKADTVCSGAGQITGAITGIGLVFLGPGGWIIKGLTAAVGAAATSAAMHFIQSTVPMLLAEDPPIGIPHRGPNGGAFDAFGSREAANDTELAMGGVKLSNFAEKQRDKEWLAEENRLLSKRPFLARVFDVYDYRSLAGSLIDSQDSNVTQNVATGFTTFTSVASTAFRAPFSLFRHTASATPQTFDWGFPAIGMSDALMNDERYANPYENDEKAVSILNKPSGAAYIARAKTCFGANIGKVDSGGAQLWGIVSSEKVNMRSAAYVDASCDETGNEDWNRISGFIGYTMSMETEACYNGIEDACTRIGQDAPIGSSSPSYSSGTQQPVSLDASQLFKSSVDIACYDEPATPDPETRDIGIYDGYWGGAKIPIRICAVPGFKSTGQESNGGFGVKGGNGELVINSRVSKNIYNMFQDAKKSGLTLSAASGFRTMEHSLALCPCDGTMVSKPGYSNHQMGIAIDFSGPSPKNRGAVSCTADRAKAPGDATWTWLDRNAFKYGYRQLMYESWHWDPIPVKSRCGGDASG